MSEKPSSFDVIAAALGGVVSRHMDAVRLVEALELFGYRIVKEVESGESGRPGFDERSYEVGYMEGENSARADFMFAKS